MANVGGKGLLSTYFEENKLLFDNQYGFRPKHSTEHAALELIDRIINTMDTNEITLNIFIDLSKAFDTIDHTILLNKLKYYGLKGSTLNLFQSYLSNRKQYTEIEDTTSTILPILDMHPLATASRSRLLCSKRPIMRSALNVSLRKT